MPNKLLYLDEDFPNSRYAEERPVTLPVNLPPPGDLTLSLILGKNFSEQ